MSHPILSSENSVVFNGSCIELLAQIPDESIQLIVTSPPYNIGKSYEKRSDLDSYIEFQKQVITECHRVLKPSGSICWQVGNYVLNSEIIPLDILLFNVFSGLDFKLRNRIIWHFEHGLHCKNRLSGRYETINWFTKSNDYIFLLDDIRVPQKYPNKKHFKGPKAGQLSGNPLGKNPGDVWIFPNVKSNHVEKTIHPCQFPVELVERLVLSLTNEDDWVLDPFLGVGSTIIAALKNNRKGIGSELSKEYADIANKRILSLKNGTLLTRPIDRPVYDPNNPKENLSFVKNKKNIKNDSELFLISSNG
ncbi:site-specific DNA-methyltransferase [Leptospira selangorensis]|uniref:Methyltransferase n=1 Tax=Leptospira selangorensis TaxID=2484982 RepID=A0ABY2N146_9LEPT|nr:site-specific DNA-methyltransferase [Leptospira selangorensis]TGM13633.1 site-specific DNA-methyltransferase [Leptospira selangorensis]